MARPARNALPGNILSSAGTFFATTKTSQGRALLQSERNVTLMIDVLRSYVAARQRGFSETRVECRQRFIKHREYIAANPVKAGLVERPEEFPYCFTYLARRKAAGAKALK